MLFFFDRALLMGTLSVLVMASLATTELLSAERLPALTSLDNPDVLFTVLDKPYMVLRAAGVEAVIVTNEGVDDETLPGHRAGYSGIGRLSHERRQQNLFVPPYAGLNYEHIHDGEKRDRTILFEPRNAPLQLRKIDDRTAELYQAPTPHYGLESCLRYQMLDDGVIEMTLECIPRRDTFKNGYIGLFWASYIHQPESLDIHFRGITPPGVQMFRPVDQVRLSQSPSGGGSGNPAWDFQFLVPDYKVGTRYQMVMRAMYLPFESPRQILKATAPHREALKR